MAWAKLHTDILGDPKLMRAARSGMKGLEYLPWLIAFAKQSDDGGRLSVGGQPAELADFVSLIPGLRAKKIAESLKNLEQIGVLVRDSDDFLRFSAWERRSGTKPSDSASAIAERVSRHRAAKSLQQNTNGNASNAFHGVSSNATEKRRVREEESKKRGEGEENGADAPPPARPRRASPPPPDWARRLADQWISRVGGTTADLVAKKLAPFFAKHGEAALVRAVDAFAESRRGGGATPKLDWFVEAASTWVDRTTPRLVVDPETGLPNELGMAILSGRA
jgi:hypothetical protein